MRERERERKSVREREREDNEKLVHCDNSVTYYIPVKLAKVRVRS